MVRPVMDGAFLVCCGTDDVGAVGVVVECVGRYPCKMSEPIPLSPTLRVQLVRIVVGNVLCQSLDVVFEGFSGESGRLRMIQWETRRWDSVSG